MSIIVCSGCKMRVLPMSDGKCPSCGYGLISPCHGVGLNAPPAIEEPTAATPASLPPCALCQSAGPTTNRIIRLAQNSFGIGSVSMERIADIQAPMCERCYSNGRRLQWHRMLAGLAIVPLMIGATISLGVTVETFGKDNAAMVLIFHLLAGLALVVWWLFWLFPYLRRRVRELVPSAPLARRLQRIARVDEFGLLCGPSFHPVKGRGDYVPVQQVLAVPLPPEVPVTATTQKGVLSGLSIRQKAIWLAVLIGAPILIMRATYFSDEQILQRRYAATIGKLLAAAEQLAKTIPSSDEFLQQHANGLASPTVSMENTIVFSTKSVIAPEYSADNRLPVDQYALTSRLGLYSPEIPAIYDWRPPGVSNDDDTDYRIFDFKAGLAQLERIEFVILVRFVDWVDPTIDGFRSVRAGRTVLDSFLFDTHQGRLVACERHHVEQGDGYVQSEEDARRQLVELVDKRIREWLAGGYAAKSVRD